MPILRRKSALCKLEKGRVYKKFYIYPYEQEERLYLACFPMVFHTI